MERKVAKAATTNKETSVEYDERIEEQRQDVRRRGGVYLGKQAAAEAGLTLEQVDGGFAIYANGIFSPVADTHLRGAAEALGLGPAEQEKLYEVTHKLAIMSRLRTAIGEL